MDKFSTFIVGRQSEVDQFEQLLAGQTPYSVLNIYGPGGIGKTVVGQKLVAHARSRQALIALADGSQPDLTSDRLLYSFMQGIVQSAPGERTAKAFRPFEREFQDYLTVNEVLERGGGIPALFDVVGGVKDPAGLAGMLGGMGSAVTETIQNRISNRFALERYLRGVDRSLTTAFVAGLQAVLENVRQPLALLKIWQPVLEARRALHPERQ